MSIPTTEELEHFEVLMKSRFLAEFSELAKMRTDMDAHRVLLAQNSAENQVLIQLVGQIKIITGILQLVEKAAVWIAKIAVACTIVWASWKYLVVEAVKQVGQLPK